MPHQQLRQREHHVRTVYLLARIFRIEELALVPFVALDDPVNAPLDRLVSLVDKCFEAYLSIVSFEAIYGLVIKQHGETRHRACQHRFF